MEYKPGDRISDKYEVVDVKRGGFGIVYISRDLELGTGIAIKTFQDRFFTSREVMSAFYHEAEVWVKLGVHDNIVAAHYVSYVDEKPHIFMEYVDGGNLREKLQQSKPNVTEAPSFAIQFCDGMIYANGVDLGGGRRGIVHRDIDPKNVMLTKEGLLKITDFGLVKALGRAPLGVAGKPPYMSPENFAGLELDTRSDIYSFGVVLYEMLTGRPPFYNQDWGWEDYEYHHLYQVPTPPKRFNSSVPSELDELVLKCLEKKMEDRYRTFGEIKGEMEKIDAEIFGGRAKEKIPRRFQSTGRSSLFHMHVRGHTRASP